MNRGLDIGVFWIAFLLSARDKRLGAARRRIEMLLARTEQIVQIGGVAFPRPPHPSVWSQQASRIVGRGASDPPLSLQAFVDTSVHPDDRPTVEAAFMRALDDGAAMDLEYRIIRTDGIIRWVHTRAEAQVEGHNRPSRLEGTLQDVTEQRAVREH